MEDLNDKITGGTLTATEWNEVPSELQNVIEALGITLSSGDLNQLGKAIAGYVANGSFYTDSGIADAYVLTQIGSKQALTGYTDGATFEFIAGNLNTGAATVNVAGLGVKNIKLGGGTDPAAGDIDGRTVLKFDSGNDWCELIKPKVDAATETTAGIAEIATQAETDAGSDDSRIITALKLASSVYAATGWGQTWQNVAGSRNINTVYTNTTGKPILVVIASNSASGVFGNLEIDGVPVGQIGDDTGATVIYSTMSAIIPNGSTYEYVIASTINIFWSELR